MDLLGTVLIMGASLALLLALQYGGVTYPWDSGVVIGLLVGAFAMILALIAAEMWQGERAMLTPRLLRQRTVWVNSVWGFFFTGAYFITLYYLPIYFQSIDNRSPVGSGVANIPLIALFSVATFASGRAITKTGIAAPYLAASSVIVTISAGLLFTLDIGTSKGKWVGYQILAGFGYGMGLQVPLIIAQAFAAPSDIAPVTAIIICELSVVRPSPGYRRSPTATRIVKLTGSLIQSLGLSAPRSSSRRRSPASSTSSRTGLEAPPRASIPRLSRLPVPRPCARYFLGPSWTLFSGRTHGVSRSLSQ